MTPDTYQRVYSYHRAYEFLNGYSPTLAEAYHALGMSQRSYYAARAWLLERHFLRKQGRCWRGVRVNLRRCTCGAEIMPVNAALGVNGSGNVFVRRPCRACYNANTAQQHRAFRAVNPGYDARFMRRQRQQRTAAS